MLVIRLPAAKMNQSDLPARAGI